MDERSAPAPRRDADGAEIKRKESGESMDEYVMDVAMRGEADVKDDAARSGAGAKRDGAGHGGADAVGDVERDKVGVKDDAENSVQAGDDGSEDADAEGAEAEDVGADAEDAWVCAFREAQAEVARLKDEIQALRRAIEGDGARTGTGEEVRGDGMKEGDRIRAEPEAVAPMDGAERRAILDRMDAVMGGRRFAHPGLRALVAEDFAAALKEPGNQGKSDREVFLALARGQGWFACQNPAALPPVEDVRTASVSGRGDFMRLSFAEQMRWKDQNPERFRAMFGH